MPIPGDYWWDDPNEIDEHWIFRQLPKSGDWTVEPDTITLKFSAGRHGDEGEVKEYAVANTPPIYKGLFRDSITAKALGGGMWHIDVKYIGRTGPGYRIRYDTTGGTAHITQAKDHIEDYGRENETPPDHGGAINVKEDGRPEGVDIVVPSFKWTEEHTLPVSLAGWAYSQVLADMSGKVNNTMFRGFPAGQVLFSGATGAYSSEADEEYEIQITYNFERQHDLDEVAYDEVMDVSKTGWEYLWFEHEQDDDDDANMLKSPLIAVHREEIYESADFGDLGIGGVPLDDEEEDNGDNGGGE